MADELLVSPPVSPYWLSLDTEMSIAAAAYSSPFPATVSQNADFRPEVRRKSVVAKRGDVKIGLHRKTCLSVPRHRTVTRRGGFVC